MSAIELAGEVLDKDEILLAQYLSELLADSKCKFIYLLMEEILPVYYEKRDGSSYTLKPDAIYRPLYYIHMFSNSHNFVDNTRAFVAMTGALIEGCL